MKSLLARLATVTLFATAVVALPTAATAHETCESPEDVPVVLEFGTLDGDDRVVCAQHSAGKTGLEALADAGIETEQSSGAMPMVCRIEGVPTPADEKCGKALNGPGYWAFLVAKDGQDWGYASVGLQEYELAEGDFVALKYHPMSEGENVSVSAAADAQTRADALVPGHDESDSDDQASGDHDEVESSFATVALPIAIGAALLVAVAAFVVARRRRS